MRVEISGGIGAGKTTLAYLLGRKCFTPLIENFALNPFWEAFFATPDKFNFETEITFLLLHYHEIKLAVGDNGNLACDFSFLQDLAYAKKGLSRCRLSIFESILHEALAEFGRPELLICLVCKPETLLKRIRARGRQEETTIDLDFLTKLTHNIYAEAHSFAETGNVLFIDSDVVDFASNESHKAEVLETICSALPYVNSKE